MSKISSIPLPILYFTNTEYRQVIRDFCNMNCIDTNESLDMDNETRDELLFDYISTANKMDEILEITERHPLWIVLYEKSAAKFFSTDIGTGLAVLLSYDFFPLFYECWTLFITSPEQFIESNPIYKKLLNAL
jgi:hypothetical protein